MSQLPPFKCSQHSIDITKNFGKFKELGRSRLGWFTPVILATQETEIRRIEVQSQPRANSS
jgi:hypothetical protein